jgi:excisionase family DNA binding protein
VIVYAAPIITKHQILAAGSAALTKAFHDWLDENREPLLQIIAHALSTSGPGTPADEIPPPADPQRPYLTTTEVARRWNCCVHTVRRKVRAGELPRLRMSQRHILIPIEAVLRFEKDASLATGAGSPRGA